MIRPYTGVSQVDHAVILIHDIIGIGTQDYRGEIVDFQVAFPRDYEILNTGLLHYNELFNKIKENIKLKMSAKVTSAVEHAN